MLVPEVGVPDRLREYMHGGRGRGQVYIPQEEAQIDLFRGFFRQIINSRLEGHFWISDDITTAQDVIIPARSWIQIPVILPNDLGPFTGLDIYALSCASVTTRSRFAQIGLEVSENGTVAIAESARRMDPNLTLANTFVYNHANRDIFMDADTPFAYLYYWDRTVLRNQEKEGLYWRRWYAPYDGTLSGIEFFIDPNSRRYIPWEDEPMQIYSGPSELHNRKEVDKYLHSSIPESNEPTLVVSQISANLYLPRTIHGICNMDTARNGAVIGTDYSQHFQMNAVVLQGGNTNSHIRAEHVCTTTPGNMPTNLLVHFVNA